jgi:hypothetical protein
MQFTTGYGVPSASGIPLPAPAPAAVNNLPATPTVDASGVVPHHTGPQDVAAPAPAAHLPVAVTPPLAAAPPLSPPAAPEPCRSSRPNKGVPGARFDGTVSAAEARGWVTTNRNSTTPERNYLGEV